MKITGILFAFCIISSYYLRLFVIDKSKDSDYFIDLQIYRTTGKLVANGINPYDFNDNPELRKKIRLTKDQLYNQWVNEDQDRWNYYSNANLPLASLFFGAVEYFIGTAEAYRYLFALFDSLLTGLIFLFVVNKWKVEFHERPFLGKWNVYLKKYYKVGMGFFVAMALSAIDLRWGTAFPEHKGIGILLTLASLYFSDSPNKFQSFILSPLLLGMSISFIGLGVFVAPVCLLNFLKNRPDKLRSSIYYTAFTVVASLAFLLPFMTGLWSMMSGRLQLNNGAPAIPANGSMWVYFYKQTPQHWTLIRNISSALFLVVVVISFFRKNLNVGLLFCGIMLVFTNSYLLTGSLDRSNVAITVAIIVLGYSNFRWALMFTVFYLLYGCISYTPIERIHRFNEKYDAYFVLFFMLLFFAYFVGQLFRKTVKLDYRMLNIDK